MSRDSRDNTSDFVNNSNNGTAFNDTNVDMEMGMAGGNASNVDHSNISTTGTLSRSPEDGILPHEILPRHLVGFEWEILGTCNHNIDMCAALLETHI